MKNLRIYFLVTLLGVGCGKNFQKQCCNPCFGKKSHEEQADYPHEEQADYSPEEEACYDSIQKNFDKNKLVAFNHIIKKNEFIEQAKEVKFKKKKLSNEESTQLDTYPLDDINWDKIIKSIKPDKFSYKKKNIVNFSDANFLYGCSSDGLLVQDEIQAIECPVLTKIRAEYHPDLKNPLPLDSELRTGLGVSAALVSNVYRLAEFDTAGFYGDYNPYNPHFKELDENFLKTKIKLKRRPTKHNILVMVAYALGGEKPDMLSVMAMFKTAYIAFTLAAKEVSNKNVTEIETGNWGCGAFGNPIWVSSIVQLVAAHIAGVKLYVHAFTDKEYQQWVAAKELFSKAKDSLLIEGVSLTPQNLFKKVLELGLENQDRPGI